MLLQRWQKVLAIVGLFLLLLTFDVYQRERRRVNEEPKELHFIEEFDLE